MTNLALVTGATGCVGSHAAAALAGAGWLVRAAGGSRAAARPETARLRTAQGPTRADDASLGAEPVDLRHAPSVARLCDGAQVVVHCAGVLQGTDAELHEGNVAALAHLLAAARTARVPRFVLISSCAVYRDDPMHRATEDHPLGGGSPYAHSKLAAERLLLQAAAHLRVVILRPCTVYGPRDRWFLPLLAHVIRNHALPAAEVPPAGANTGGASAEHDLVHAADLAQAITAAAAADVPSGRVYNIAGPRPLPLLQTIALVAEALGLAPYWAIARTPLPPDRLPLPAHLAAALSCERTLDTSRATRELRFRACVDPVIGLRAATGGEDS